MLAFQGWGDGEFVPVLPGGGGDFAVSALLNFKNPYKLKALKPPLKHSSPKALNVGYLGCHSIQGCPPVLQPSHPQSL